MALEGRGGEEEEVSEGLVLRGFICCDLSLSSCHFVIEKLTMC